MRYELLEKLHKGHLGVNRSLARARQVMYWPNITREIKEKLQNCSTCQKFQAKKSKEPLMPHDIPNIPFHKVGSDIFEWEGQSYLLIMDYYSKWIDYRKLKNKSATEVIDKWMELFSLYGIPKTIIADNNPFNSNQCKIFAKNWNCNIITSSPMHAKSNGLAERGVQIVKNILKKSRNVEDIYLGLREYRNTPIMSLNYSPFSC